MNVWFVFSVAEFAQKVSLAHEQFANQVLNVVETFKKKNQELRKEKWVSIPYPYHHINITTIQSMINTIIIIKYSLPIE